jgi:hypothetical protein
MEKIQAKSKQSPFNKPISFYNKYNCETCKYHTNFKNSFNKHVKSAKHISLNPPTEVEETVQTDCDINVVEEEKPINREPLSEDLQSEVVMDASMGFITVEEVKKDTTNDKTFQYNEYQLSKLVDLMDMLNDKINDKVKNDIKTKCFYFGLGFLFHSVIHLFIRSQRSDFFELSG